MLFGPKPRHGLIALGAVGLQVLSHSNRRAEDLVKLQRKIAAYRQLQRELAQAAGGLQVGRILDLGTGTGETAAVILEVYPAAELIGIDESPCQRMRVHVLASGLVASGGSAKEGCEDRDVTSGFCLQVRVHGDAAG